MNTGQYISGGGHLAVIGYVLFGGMFLTPETESQIQSQEVALISEAEFAALTAQDSAPDTFEEAPVLQAPEAPAPELTAPEVSEEPPAPLPQPELSLEDPGAQTPSLPETPPAPRPVPRIADQVVVQPEPTPEIAPTPTPEVSPEAETPDVVAEEQPAAAPEESTTEIVTEAETPAGISASPRPKSRPATVERAAAAAKEAPTPPEPDAAETAENALADAAAALAAEAAQTPAAPDRPVGPPLTSGEREGLRVAVSQCWNVGAMSSEAMRTTITVGVNMNEDGKPNNGSIKLLGFEGGSDAGARAAFEVARRAIIRCGARGFPLPVDKYAHWRNIEMRFDPEQMRFK